MAKDDPLLNFELESVEYVKYEDVVDAQQKIKDAEFLAKVLEQVKKKKPDQVVSEETAAVPGIDSIEFANGEAFVTLYPNEMLVDLFDHYALHVVLKQPGHVSIWVRAVSKKTNNKVTKVDQKWKDAAEFICDKGYAGDESGKVLYPPPPAPPLQNGLIIQSFGTNDKYMVKPQGFTVPVSKNAPKEYIYNWSSIDLNQAPQYHLWKCSWPACDLDHPVPVGSVVIVGDEAQVMIVDPSTKVGQMLHPTSALITGKIAEVWIDTVKKGGQAKVVFNPSGVQFPTTTKWKCDVCSGYHYIPAGHAVVGPIIDGHANAQRVLISINIYKQTSTAIHYDMDPSPSWDPDGWAKACGANNAIVYYDPEGIVAKYLKAEAKQMWADGGSYTWGGIKTATISGNYSIHSDELISQSLFNEMKKKPIVSQQNVYVDADAALKAFKKAMEKVTASTEGLIEKAGGKQPKAVVPQTTGDDLENPLAVWLAQLCEDWNLKIPLPFIKMLARQAILCAAKGYVPEDCEKWDLV